MQVRPQRDWPRARSIQGLLQQRDGGMYARAARQVAPRSRKDLRSTRHGASGKHKHASECGSVRGSVEGAARGSRASREGRLITSQTRAEPSGIDRVAAKEPVTRGWSSSHPAHATRTHTPEQQNARLAPRLEHAYVTTGLDFGADRPVAPPLGHMSGRRRDSRSRSR